jgi:gliding motility-associated-like protein
LISNIAYVKIDTLPDQGSQPESATNPGRPVASCTNPSGCPTEIPVLAPIKIPNVITPNGDGFNDYFIISGTHSFDKIEVIIFNRWNNQVYQSKNYSNDWSGIGLNAGTYFYNVKAHNKNTGRWESYNGYVMILR